MAQGPRGEQLRVGRTRAEDNTARDLYRLGRCDRPPSAAVARASRDLPARSAFIVLPFWARARAQTRTSERAHAQTCARGGFFVLAGSWLPPFRDQTAINRHFPPASRLIVSLSFHGSCSPEPVAPISLLSSADLRI